MFTLAELAELVAGQIAGDPTVTITGANPFDSAQPGDITFAGAPAYWGRIDQCPASAVIVPLSCPPASKPILRARNPKEAFARITAHLYRRPFEANGIAKMASIGEACSISDRVSIAAFVSVGDRTKIGDEVTLHAGVSIGADCSIGRGCVLHANVTLYPGVVLGDRVVIHSGTVIGADGFGYVFNGSEQVKVPQLGSVEIQDDVEIGANSCVDRATFGKTVIERGVKIDNQVHIAHNCRIGENTIIVGCVGISGSVRIGRNCIIAGQAGVADHVSIGDNVIVMQKTAVTKDVPSGTQVAGLHGREYRQELKIEALQRRLPEILARLKALEKRDQESGD